MGAVNPHFGHVHAELQNSKKTYGRENIRWKTSGEATQEMDRCCVLGD
jgi:hypothetical protein